MAPPRSLPSPPEDASSPFQLLEQARAKLGAVERLVRVYYAKFKALDAKLKASDVNLKAVEARLQDHNAELKGLETKVDAMLEALDTIFT